MSERLWITWEHHRRSKELAGAFSCTYTVVDHSNKPAFIRYALSSIKTSRLLFSKRWATVFVQCPSLVLTALIALLRNFRSFTFIIDAHNALPNYERSSSALLRWVAAYVSRKADVVIVTNEELEAVIEAFGGTPVILPDKLPSIPERPRPTFLEGSTKPTIVLICSFAWDEPIDTILQAVNEGARGTVWVTGKRARAGELLRYESEQIRFTDYLPDEDFEALIQHADLLIDITTDPRILVCGAYESVAVGVPSLLADFEVTRSLFYSGSVYATNSVASYTEALQEFERRKDELSTQMKSFAPEFEKQWKRRFDTVAETLTRLEAA